MVLSYKIFDIYTGKYILEDAQNPESILTEEVENSLLEKILPPDAANKLSVAVIEQGMDTDDVENSHPDSDNNVLLLSRGSRGIYGPPEYKQILAPYLDTTFDYAYHRYLLNENERLLTKQLKVWVIDDEEHISGIDSVNSKQAGVILGDSHGKISYDLAQELGDPKRLIQYRMTGSKDNPFFAKGTFHAGLAQTLDQHGLSDNPDLAGVDMILSTSSIKGISKQNLPPGIHEIEVDLTNHQESGYRSYTLKAVAEKLSGDAFSYALSQQDRRLEKFNETFADSEKLDAAFVKSLEPKGEDFDPDNWESCDKWDYIIARKDLESGHKQLLNSPIFAERKQKFYANAARQAAQLDFLKVRGGMIYCSHELKNNEICVPYLKEGEKIAAIRSPIIQLPDIALVTNRQINDVYNDRGEMIEGAIICSPQMYDALIDRARNFVKTQTQALNAAGLNTNYLNQLNAFNWQEYQDTNPATLNGKAKQEFTAHLNRWREEYNRIVDENQLESPHLEQIRLDTFTKIISGDFDGDNIAILPQSQYPELYGGIESQILTSDTTTLKLDKIQIEDENETLGSILARKADPYTIGKVGNLAEDLQSLAVEAARISEYGRIADKQAYLTRIAPVMYYLAAPLTEAEWGLAEAKKVPATFRDYTITDPQEALIERSLIYQFDAYGLDKSLPSVVEGNNLNGAETDRAIKLWRDLLLNINDRVSQQNQIAVDTFKSDREVDKDFIEGISRRLKLVKDNLKRQFDDNTTYLEQAPVVNNAVTNRGLLTENANQKLMPYQAVMSNYQQIQGLFPQEEEDPELVQSINNQIFEFKRLSNLAKSYRDKSSIDKGPSLLLHQANRTLEITNINRYQHTPKSLGNMMDLTGKPLTVKLVENKNKNQAHQFIALYQDSLNKWKRLGTLCEVCRQTYDISKPEETTTTASQVDFITSRGEFLAEKYTKDADHLVTQFLAEIPDGQRARYAAITYNLLSDTYKQSNNFAFMFKAFGPELAQRLEQLHLTQICLNDIEQAGVLEIANGSVQQVVFAADEKDPNPSHEDCYLIDGDTRTRIGKITRENFHLPLETKAQVTINFAPPAQGTFTLPNGKSFTLGGMNKSDSAGEVFFDREILMSIDRGNPNYTPLLMLNNKSLGRLSDRSVKFLKSQGLLERGQNFKLTLTREGLDRASRIYATTANSKVTLELVEISRFAHPDFKQRQFREEEFDVSVGYKENPAKLTGYLHRNGKRISLGEFNRNHKKSADFVRQHRMVGSKPFKVKVTSMPTCLDLTIDPESVEYPEAGVNRFLAAASVEQLSTEVNATTQEFLAQAKSYQTIARFGDRTWSDREGAKIVILSLDLILDSKKVEFLSSLLEKYNFTLVNDSSTALEQRKGFVVYSVPTTAINAADWQDITANFQLNRVFDQHLGGLPTKVAYRFFLQNNFSNLDLVKDDLLLNQSGELEEVNTAIRDGEETSPSLAVKLDLGFDYPLLDANLPDKTSDVVTPSAKLVELVKHSTLLSQIEAITLAKELNRYDYQWLNSRLEPESKIDSPNSAVEVLAGDNLVRAQTILSQFLIPQEELVYQHFTQDYEDEYEFDYATEQLKALLGKEKYSLYQTEVEHLIKENIAPVVIANLGVRTPIELLEERPDVIMPLPEFINPQQALPMSLGKPGNEVAEALANPQDKNNPEKISRPIEFKGRTYPSTQAAYSAIAPTIPRKQTYQLTKDLLEVKFTQHPELITAIDANGGKNWLNTCRYYNDNDYMSGVGSDSGYIRAVGYSYDRAKSKIARLSQVNGQKVISLKPGQNNKAKAASEVKDMSVGKTEISLPEPIVIANSTALSAPPLSTNVEHQTTKTTTLMSFISFANEGVEENFNQAKNSLNTEAAVATKQQMLEVVTEEIDYAVVSDTLRVWGNGASANNALVATFKGVNNSETIAYSAARIGQEFNQSRVSYFIEDPKGQDTLYSFSVANADLDQIKNTLASLKIKGYTLLPTKSSTKILIPDRDGRMGTVINNLKNHYGQQPKRVTGHSRMVERHQYPSITRTYQSARQRDGREGLCCRGDITRLSSANHGRTRNRATRGLQGESQHGTKRPRPQPKNRRDSDKSMATARRVGRVEGAAPDDGRRVTSGYRLPDSVKPRLHTPLEKQQQAVTKAIPTLAKILNSTSTKKLYQNEQFKLTYNSSNRIMQLVDRGQVKMVAQHDQATNRWISLTDVPSLDEPAIAALQQVLEAIEAAPAVPTEAVTNSTPKLRDRLGERKDPSNVAQADDPEAKTAALER